MARRSSECNVKLLGTTQSPYVNRVQIALNLKSVYYEFENEDLFKKTHLLLKSNPIYKKVPVLIHNGNPICESLIILEYIDQVWTQSPYFFSSHPIQRASARFWASYIDLKWFTQVRKLVGAKDEEKADLVKGIMEGLIFFEEEFVKCNKGEEEFGGGYFGGKNIGYVDIVLGSLLGWVQAMEIIGNAKLFDETKTPQLVGWVDRFLSNDAAKGIVLDPRLLVDLSRNYKASTSSA